METETHNALPGEAVTLARGQPLAGQKEKPLHISAWIN